MTSPQPGASSVQFSYEGAQVLVTGGTSGIGAAVARAYQQAGATVTITGTRPSAKDYDADFGNSRYLQLDVGNHQQLSAVAAAQPKLDILVHSGGIGLAAIGKNEWEPDNFDLAVQMHLTSVYRLTHACLDKLSESRLAGGASVIGIASMSSYFGIEVVPAYGAAKGGLVQLMKTMGVAWAKRGIRANAVAAGLIKTRQTAAVVDNPEWAAPHLARTPMNRLGEASEVADAVLFLTSSGASYLTGQTINVCGGFSIQG